MSGLFISYRREDSAADAGRLFENLQLCCQSDVYLDLTTPVGLDFRAVLAAKLDACDVALVLIGPRWLAARDQKTGARRIDDANDLVRFEISAALAKGKTIIPVILPGGQLPQPDELPPDIRELTWRQAVEIRYARWTDDVNALIDKLPPSLRCARHAESRTPESRLWLALQPILLMTAAHVMAVYLISQYDVTNLLPEVFYIGLSLAFGALHAARSRLAVRTHLAMAAAIALGVGILTSTAVPLLWGQDIIPHSLVPIKLFAILAAGVFAGYLTGASVADALIRRRGTSRV